MPPKTDEVCKSVLEKVTPKRRERTEIQTLADRLKDKIISASEALDIETDVRVEGSVAKDTWLSKEPDIDLFMQVPTTIPRKSLGDICLKIARKATEGYEQMERFAEHPYLEAIVDGTIVNIVPCYRVEQGEWLSATDRTPFHTDYIKEHLKDHMKGEVRLLKKFNKGIEVYGAEIKIGGFSGYLCELLILYYKSFVDTLEAFSRHKERTIIDIQNHYQDREDELPLLFEDKLIVVDPVDKSRNVASAVKPQKLYTFVSAARAFLRNPSQKFFYPPETHPLPVKDLEQKLADRDSAMIFVTFGKVEAVPDVLWGQLYKSQSSMHKQIQLNGFHILRSAAWSDEKNINIFIFEVEQRSIPSVNKHWGPPLKKREACQKFLGKHIENPNTVSGPYIEEGRWVVEIHRKYTDIVEFLTDKLEDGGRRIGVAEKISTTLRNRFNVFVDEKVAEVYAENVDFAKFLTQFLSGKPRWL